MEESFQAEKVRSVWPVSSSRLDVLAPVHDPRPGRPRDLRRRRPHSDRSAQPDMIKPTVNETKRAQAPLVSLFVFAFAVVSQSS